jgi:serine/threonine protein phosphatase 1
MWVKLLQIQWAMKPDETFAWLMRHGAEATLRAYGGEPQHASSRFRSGVVVTTRWTNELRQRFTGHRGHDAFVHGLLAAALTADRSLLFVSAGIDPAKPLTKQVDSFWWGAPGFATMTDYDPFKLIVRGYDGEHRGLRIEPPLASIDGGCGFGGPLNAMCFSASGEAVEELSVEV